MALGRTGRLAPWSNVIFHAGSPPSLTTIRPQLVDLLTEPDPDPGSGPARPAGSHWRHAVPQVCPISSEQRRRGDVPGLCDQREAGGEERGSKEAWRKICRV